MFQTAFVLVVCMSGIFSRECLHFHYRREGLEIRGGIVS